VNIFLSHSSAQKDVATQVCFALQAAGHEVFFDREDLPSGQSYNDHIARAIDACDLFVFLISPDSVTHGRYTLTELKVARRKWDNPSGRVLPVMVVPTPLEGVPGYLKAVTILEPEGNLAAEIVMAVADLAPKQASGVAKDARREAANVAGEMPVSYRSVQLRFGGASKGTYSLAVAESPAGSRPAAPCALDPISLESLLWSSAERVEASVRRAGPGSDAPLFSVLPSAEGARNVGQRLYESLFGSPMRECIEESLRTVFPQRREGLRFVINTTEAPELARLPWEFLYSPRNDDFLFSDTMKPVVRWLDVDEPPPTLTVEPPLRLLIAIASPEARAELSVGEEIAHLDRALASVVESGLVETARIEHTTLERLDEALLEKKPHILHFIGHGDFAGDDGVVILEADADPGAAHPVTGRQLGALLRNHLASLRLVFLNSCMGAAVAGHAPFGGVAQSLIRRGIPAVIAMQFPISDRAAVALARHFYRYVAAGLPVDAALTSARAFLYARGYAVEWGSPALHMRAPDGRLFDLGAGAAAHPPTAAPVPGPVAPSVGSAAAEAAVPVEPRVGAEPPLAIEVPASMPPPEAPAAKRSNRRVIALLVLGVLLIGAVGTWYLARPGTAVPTPPVVAPPNPSPPTPPAVVPTIPSPPTPPAVVPTNPSPPTPPMPTPKPASAARLALEQLDSGNVEAAANSLHALLAQDAKALTAEHLGTLHDQLAQSLTASAEQAFAAGKRELGERLLGILSAMAPLDPAVKARVSKLFRSLPTAVATSASNEERMLYTVRRGDTLWRIAARFTGDPRNWRRIYTYQDDAIRAGVIRGPRIVDPNLIRPGQQIAVPPSFATGANTLDYHVSRGESLSSIARRVYGDPEMWRHIYRDNASQIADPNRIYPGQVLILTPLRPAR
jgi:nucleoid-associated protein YgaU